MNRNILSVMLLAFVFLSSGCTIKYFDGHKEQMSFTPPNSNVEPSGARVFGKSSSTKFYWMMSTVALPSFSSELLEEATSSALKGTDSDLLINTDVIHKSTKIPLMLFDIVVSTIEVDGQPAKIIEIGKQDLK